MATEVLVPPLGQTVDTVTLVTWYKNEGDLVAQGDPLFAIETDKATLDVEAPASGVLWQVSAQSGDAVKVLTAIALIAAPQEVVEQLQSHPSRRSTTQSHPSPLPAQESKRRGNRDERRRILISPRARRLAEKRGVPLTALQATGPEGAIIERDVHNYLRSRPAATPVAEKMAAEAGLDLRELTGTGPGGKITRDDVERTLKAAQPVPPAARINEVVEAMPLRGVRSVIAERMLRSVASTAHVTLTAEADATALVELRCQLREDGVEVSYNDLFLYILGHALREHPSLNSSLEGDVIKLWRRIHIGLAVDTERGLLVPVVRDVDRKGLLQLAEETQSLSERARLGQCTPDDLRGGTFTLTNLGMFGIDAFTPLINLPECAILGLGRIKWQPVMVEDEVIGRHLVWLSLTFDHRLVDGAPAARFLQRVVQLVGSPHLLMT